jgi:hypothetical protein
MGMPGEAAAVLVRIVRAEIIEQEEGIVFLREPKADRAVKMNARTFHGRPAFDHLADAPLGCHGPSYHATA